jgi:hypothetical protein
MACVREDPAGELSVVLAFWQVIVSRYMGLLCGPLNLAKIFLSFAKEKKTS